MTNEIPADIRVRYYLDLVKDPCAYCGRLAPAIPLRRPSSRLRMTRDHIAPVGKQRKFPTRRWDNLTAACYLCNNAKADTSLLHFMLERI